jgi:para-nitrobenzyl esterase
MGTYWINFTKYGNPNGEGVPAWPAFTKSNPAVMYFSQTPHTGPVPGEKSLEVLDKYFKWRFTLEGATWVKRIYKMDE